MRLRTVSTVVTLKAMTCLIVVLAIYYQDLQIIFLDAVQNEATSQMLLVLPLVVYIIYRKRKILRAVVSDQQTIGPKATQHFTTLIGILLCTTAMLFYWYGSYTFTPLEYHILTLPVFSAGLILLLFNLQTARQLAFPIAFLFFLFPIPEEIILGVSSILSISTSRISSTIAHALGVPSTISTIDQIPTIIITRPDNSILGFSLDTACSGIYPLIGFIMFALFVAFIIRDKPWKKAVILILGIPLMYFLNVFRVTIVLLLGYNYGAQLALDTFHLFGGLALTILGAVLLLAVLEGVFETQIFLRGGTTQPCNECQSRTNNQEDFCYNCGRLLQYPKMRLKGTEIAKILAALIAVSLLIWIQVPAFAVTQGPAKLLLKTPTGEQGNTEILPQIADYYLSFILRDSNFENKSHQDASLMYLYSHQNHTKENVWVGIEVAQTRSSLHRWEVCRIIWPTTHGYDPSVRQLDLRDIQILENPPIVARYFAFQYKGSNVTQVVLYWFETSSLILDDTLQQKQVKISLISYPRSPQEIQETEDDLRDFALAIAGYWQPTKTWTKIALTISKNGLTMSTISAALLVCVIVIAVTDVIKRRKTITRTYSKLPDEARQIVDAIQKIEKNSVATIQNIAATSSDTSTDLKTLNGQLIRAEEAGLISPQITNRNDEPIQSWKSNVSA